MVDEASIQSIPISQKCLSQVSDAVTTDSEEERDEMLVRIAEETAGKIVGPMPPELFLDAYLARPQAEMRDLKGYGTNIRKLESYKKKKLMYSAFIQSVEPLCRKLHFFDTSSSPMIVFNNVQIKPDVCAYTESYGSNLRDISQPALSIMFEMKPNKNYDPFIDPGEKLGNVLLRDTDKAKETLGQITSYAAAHQSAQFRTHIFNVLVFPSYCRLLRWDRSGVVVTRKISLTDSLLPEFLHRYEHATPEDRGEDASVSIPSPDIANAARRALDLTSSVTVLQASVSLGKGEYVFRRDTYMNTNKSPLGRSTRSFLAYSIDSGAVVFIKDAWRVASQTPEHEVYAKLHKHHVPYIATVVDAADIMGHATRTQDLLRVEVKPSWAVETPDCLRKHIHYRLVLKEVASPLTAFPSTKFLVKVIQEAIVAHQKAHEAKILHRDISVNNVMIYNDHALLLDWDLSKGTDEDREPRETERTGTWQFMAARLLFENVDGPHDLTDDLESFLHLMTWMAFVYTSHEMPLDILRYFLKYTYDYSRRHSDGRHYGGRHKPNYLIVGTELHEAKFANQRLYQLLVELTKNFAARYMNGSMGLSFLGGDLIDENLKKHLIHAHETTLANIKKPEWMIKTISKYLEMEGWPENDVAVKRNLFEKSTYIPLTSGEPESLKRSRESSPEEETRQKNKRMKLSA